MRTASSQQLADVAAWQQGGDHAASKRGTSCCVAAGDAAPPLNVAAAAVKSLDEPLAIELPTEQPNSPPPPPPMTTAMPSLRRRVAPLLRLRMLPLQLPSGDTGARWLAVGAPRVPTTHLLKHNHMAGMAALRVVPASGVLQCDERGVGAEQHAGLGSSARVSPLLRARFLGAIPV